MTLSRQSSPTWATTSRELRAQALAGQALRCALAGAGREDPAARRTLHTAQAAWHRRQELRRQRDALAVQERARALALREAIATRAAA